MLNITKEIIKKRKFLVRMMASSVTVYNISFAILHLSLEVFRNSK